MKIEDHADRLKPGLKTPEAGHTISIHISNLTAKDARFLSEVIALFTDDENAPLAGLVRRNVNCIMYGTLSGAAYFDPITIFLEQARKDANKKKNRN